MPKKRSWNEDQLIEAVKSCKSYRAVLIQIGLIPAGGNYQHVVRITNELKLDTSHFTGKGWNQGWGFDPRIPQVPLEKLLINGSTVQSFGLKKRLFNAGLKKPMCELCGWAEKSLDGRIPVELDHINGVHGDNRLENLRILCPNCHSLQSTHRGRNKQVRLRRLTN
jgi:hypothetical protein